VGSGDSLQPNGNPKIDGAQRDVLQRFDGELSMTLRDAYRVGLELSWTEFVNAVSRLISEGYLIGKGDGFVVHYTLTPKGRNEVGKRL
jgi:hypothetical protein